LGWLKKFGLAQNIFGPVKGQGITLDMGVFIWSMGSPNCKDIKIAIEEVHFCVKGLSKMDPLNHKRLDFSI
jgi:hypothetical protein